MNQETFDKLTLDNSFWQFSLSFWKDQSAQQAMITLQDEFGLDVNLLLFSIWLSLKNENLAPYTDRAMVISQYWQEEIIQHIRSARRGLPKSSPLRESMQKLELEAEQIEQAALYALTVNLKGPENPAEQTKLFVNNLKIYINSAIEDRQTIPQSLISILAKATFPALSLEIIHNHLTTWSL